VILILEACIADHAHGVFGHGALESLDRLRRDGRRSVQTGDFSDKQRVKLIDDLHSLDPFPHQISAYDEAQNSAFN
jgi:hypothetical protein